MMTMVMMVVVIRQLRCGGRQVMRTPSFDRLAAEPLKELMRARCRKQ